MSLLSYRDVFVCRSCLGHNCSVEEKLEFKRGEDVLEEVEKFCRLGNMISCYEAVSARIGSARSVIPVLLYCCETRELTVADEGTLRGVECCIIRMCMVRLVDRVSTDVLRDMVGVVVQIEDMIIQSRLRWYDYVIRRDINSQMREVLWSLK